MNIYDYISFKDFINDWINSQKNNGRGIAKKISEEIGVSTVLMSQILKGSRSLQLDYAYGIAEFIDLSNAEKDFFLLLVQYENSANYKYREHLLKSIKKIAKENNRLSKKVIKSITLSEKDNAQFYSHWHYSALRLASDIEGLNTLQAMSERFDISESVARDILEFLVSTNLCKKEGGKYLVGAGSTHLDKDSPWVYTRQLQWRQRSILQMEKKREEDLFYTGPMVLSKSDAEWVKKSLMEYISKMVKRIQHSPSEELMCLNIDWFKF